MVNGWESTIGREGLAAERLISSTAEKLMANGCELPTQENREHTHGQSRSEPVCVSCMYSYGRVSTYYPCAKGGFFKCSLSFRQFVTAPSALASHMTLARRDGIRRSRHLTVAALRSTPYGWSCHSEASTQGVAAYHPSAAQSLLRNTE